MTGSPNSAAIEVTGLARTYGSGDAAVRALRGVDFSVSSGEFVALTGPSGSGKTTLLNCLLGLDRGDSGSIEVLGTAIDQLSYEQAVEWRRQNIAIVFQATGLIPHLSGHENVDVVLRIKEQLSRSERRDRVDATLDALGIGDLANHLPEEMSGGQRQRFAIARALVARPAVLIADEPTGELDSDTAQAVLAVLRTEASNAGTTMVIATHDSLVADSASRLVAMSDGQITEVGNE